ncbi:MAG: MTAP family purine nucleoside phosphorylase [Thermoplasmatota archaeon]
MMKIGILCGHPMNRLFDEFQELDVETPYNKVHMLVGKIQQHQVFFINRHGSYSKTPPHVIDYRANMQALASSHVDCVISIGTVGSMKQNITPGDVLIPHDFFDATHSRAVTFYDDSRVHVDMTDPFCPSLRTNLITASKQMENLTVHQSGVYVATQGPRLETVAEIGFYATVGDIVGMTLVPEVVLAREKGLCFASVCVVCNMAAGLQKTLPVDDIKRIYAEKEAVVASILKKTMNDLSSTSDCQCQKKIQDALL